MEHVVNTTTTSIAMIITDINSSKVSEDDPSIVSVSVGAIASHIISPSFSTTTEQYESNWCGLFSILMIGLVSTHS